MIIEEIKRANIEAMKSKDSNLRNIFGILINKYMQITIEARTTNKPVTDDDMTRIIQKTIKELDEEAENYLKVNHLEEAEKIKKQKEAIVKYLPQMVSEQDIFNFISALSDKSVPSVMRALRAEFGSKIDMKLAGEILKKF